MSWSLRRRFFTISSAVTLTALTAAGILLVVLFERDIKARIDTEIHNHFAQLAGTLELEKGGNVIKTSSMADPRFRQPGSGLYWQVDDQNETLLRSRSLWDSTLATPGYPFQAIEEPTRFSGPYGDPVLIHARLITLENGGQTKQLRVLIGVDDREVTTPVARFALLLGLSLLVMAVAMIAVSAIQLRVVLTPLARLRRSIRDIRDGKAEQVTANLPLELQPVSAKLNSLLKHQEQVIEKARTRAGNFAHGLKTPLTVIDVLISALADGGNKDIAVEVLEQTAAIRKLVERELTRSQLVAGHGRPVQDAGLLIDDIINAMKHLPNGQDIQFINGVPPDQPLPINRDDLTELLGNVLDNARKWAASQIRITIQSHQSRLALNIDDDGPGVGESDLASIIERGKRLDERAQGSGIGLAIVRDIADAYDSTLVFARSDLGGLHVCITFPKPKHYSTRDA